MATQMYVFSPGGFIESKRHFKGGTTCYHCHIHANKCSGHYGQSVCVSVCGWGGGGGITFHPVGTRRWTSACFLAHLLIYLPITTTPFTSYTHKHTHTRTEVARVQSRGHKDPSELNKLALFQRISHLSCTAHNRSESALLTLYTHSLTHTHTHTKLRVKKHCLSFPKQPGQPCPNVLNIILKFSFDWTKWPWCWISLQH